MLPTQKTPQKRGGPPASRGGPAPGAHPTAHCELRVCRGGARSNDRVQGGSQGASQGAWLCLPPVVPPPAKIPTSPRQGGDKDKTLQRRRGAVPGPLLLPGTVSAIATAAADRGKPGPLAGCRPCLHLLARPGAASPAPCPSGTGRVPEGLGAPGATPGVTPGSSLPGVWHQCHQPRSQLPWVSPKGVSAPRCPPNLQQGCTGTDKRARGGSVALLPAQIPGFGPFYSSPSPFPFRNSQATSSTSPPDGKRSAQLTPTH